MRLLQVATVAALLFALPGWAEACWDEAGQRYGVSPQLIYAIARVESGLNPQAVNLTHRQRTRSYDIGLMQINSSNLRALAATASANATSTTPVPTSTSVRGCWRKPSAGKASAGRASAPTTPPVRSSRARLARLREAATPGRSTGACRALRSRQFTTPDRMSQHVR